MVDLRIVFNFNLSNNVLYFFTGHNHMDVARTWSVSTQFLILYMVYFSFYLM